MATALLQEILAIAMVVELTQFGYLIYAVVGQRHLFCNVAILAGGSLPVYTLRMSVYPVVPLLHVSFLDINFTWP